MHACMHACIHTYIHTYIHTQHTHTHTAHTHTHCCCCQLSSHCGDVDARVGGVAQCLLGTRYHLGDLLFLGRHRTGTCNISTFLASCALPFLRRSIVKRCKLRPTYDLLLRHKQSQTSVMIIYSKTNTPFHRCDKSPQQTKLQPSHHV